MSRRALRRLRGEWRGQGLLGEETPLGGLEARGGGEDEEVAEDQLLPVSGGGRRRRGPRREPLERVANPFELVRTRRGPAEDPQQPGGVPRLPRAPSRVGPPRPGVCVDRGAGASRCLSAGWVAAPALCGWLRSVGSTGVSPESLLPGGVLPGSVPCWWGKNFPLVRSPDPAAGHPS